jgi:hypothetical protein
LKREFFFTALITLSAVRYLSSSVFTETLKMIHNLSEREPVMKKTETQQWRFVLIFRESTLPLK